MNVLDIIQTKDIEMTEMIGHLQQAGGRKVELWTAGLQESRRGAEVSPRGGRILKLGHQKLHNCHWRLDSKWKSNKLSFIT